MGRPRRPRLRHTRRDRPLRFRRRRGRARHRPKVARETGVPVAFGVLTTNNTDQALARSGGAQGNRGFDAVEAAIKMASVHRQL